MPHFVGSPAGFFFDLTRSGQRTVLTRINYATGYFPPPLLRGETVSPHHEHAVSVVDYYGHSYTLEAYDMMLESPAIRRLNVNLRQSDPTTLVESALTEDLCLQPASVRHEVTHYPGAVGGSPAATGAASPVPRQTVALRR